MFPSNTNGTLVDSGADAEAAAVAGDAAVALVALPDVALGDEAPLFPPPPAKAAVGNVDDPCRISVMYCLTNLM